LYADGVRSEPATRRCIGVPFLDLGPSHSALKPDILAAVSELIDEGAFTNGSQVPAFERAFADFCGTADAVGLANGLDALRLALVATGLEPGDEVIVPAGTFVATFEAVTQAGGRPVVVDISDTDYGLDVNGAESVIGPRTRVVLPVHLYGQMADMRAIARLSSEHGLQVIEDACQAHGAEREGVRAGAGGIAGAFSFYPAKNLGAFGDAGALVTNDEELARRVRALREHGQREKYRHDFEGYTARLDTIQALVLIHKLPWLGLWTDQRREAARHYEEALAGVGDLHLPPVTAGSDPVWHLFVVRTSDPTRLASHLRERGIGTGRHYPEPPHLSGAYAFLGHQRGEFPVAESLAEQALSLPLFPGITEGQIGAVVEAVEAYFSVG
jgi:dTDP-3-amino-3,4,6-trideoxy-alpha-D-glucose transaminase